MSVVSVGQADGPPVRQFLLVSDGPPASDLDVHRQDSLDLRPQSPGVCKTVTLIERAAADARRST